MPGLGFAFRMAMGGAAIVTPTAALTGFTLNGSSNAAVKTMMTSKAGLIVYKGHSLVVGQGASPSGTSPYVAGARPFRKTARMAAKMVTAGYPARDGAFVGDGNVQALHALLDDYDPRASTGWDRTNTVGWYPLQNTIDTAGGDLFATATTPITFTPEIASDTFLVTFINIGPHAVTFTVGGAAPATVDVVQTSGNGPATVNNNVATWPGNNYGITVVRVRTSSATTQPLSMVSTNASGGLYRVEALNSASPGIRLQTHALCGGQAYHGAQTNGVWSSIDLLKFDAPALTIIEYESNEAANSTSVSDYTTAMGTIIDAAKLSGDVLLVSPHPASTSFASTDRQTAFQQATASLAQQRGIAYMNFQQYFPTYAGIADQIADGLVHGKASLYDTEAGVVWQCIQAMAAA